MHLAHPPPLHCRLLPHWLLLSFLAGAISLHARLGENEAQLDARFGQPVLQAVHNIIAQGKIINLGPRRIYREGDWTIDCDLIDGKCVRVRYHKPGEWTEDQFQLVLNANSQGARWSDVSNPAHVKLKREWKRSDGSTAEWTVSSITVVWQAYAVAKAKAEERARIEASRKPKI